MKKSKTVTRTYWPKSAKQPPSPVAMAKLQQAVALHQQGRLAEAAALYREVLQACPRNFDALHLLGVVALQAGHPQNAVELIGKAIALDPRQAAAHSNLGSAWKDLKRPQEALASFDRALRLDPNAAGAFYNRGAVLQELGRPQEALDSYAQALRLQPGYAEAHNNRGISLQSLGRLEEALASFGRALQCNPGYVEAFYNRGNILQELGRPEAALASFDRALQIQPGHAEAHYNRAVVLQELGRPQEALAGYAQTLRLQPGHADAHFNESVARLALGDFERGFEKYEWRWKKKDALPQARFPQPLWLGGESLRGKTILLHAEQGYGDTMQFCRYAKPVADAGARVLLGVPAGLKALLATLAGVDQVLDADGPLPAFDCHCPLLSLPLALRTRLDTLPADIPYLRADPARVRAWQARLGDGALPRIGLAWSGGTAYQNDRKRSMPLASFDRLASCRAQFISLQKEVRVSDQPVLDRRVDIAHYGGELSDFAETAALVANLDLVIAVDTAVAHLAGALGKPVWLLLPFNADWRWLLDRDDSPWYPTARLFRQARPGDWDGVIARVAAALAAFIPS